MRKWQTGLSLIEIMLVVAIIVILAVVAFPVQNRILTSNDLSEGTANIQMALHTASLQSKIGSNGLSAGVWIDKIRAGNQSIILYRGPSFSERTKDLDSPVDLPGGLAVTVTPEQDIRFHVLTGETDHDTIIKIKNTAGERTLRVNTLGTVIEEKNAE